MNWSLSPDWISAAAGIIGTGVAAYAAKFGLETFSHQKTTKDVELALTIFHEINRYWDRIDESIGSDKFNYGQLLAQFEVACHLFNKEILSDSANAIIGDHIIEVFSVLSASEEGKKLLEECRSSNSTFQQIREFQQNNLPQALLSVSYSDEKEGE